MPEYYNHKNYRGYEVEVSPVGLRKIFRKMPYFVGDRVVLNIKCKVRSQETVNRHRLNLVYYETHPDNHTVRHTATENGLTRFTSNIITNQGDFAIFLGLTSGKDAGTPVFVTEIIHRDKRRYDIFLVLLGAVLSCIISVLLGLVDIQKFWKIWIP